jgi:hypothetical protein
MREFCQHFLHFGHSAMPNKITQAHTEKINELGRGSGATQMRERETDLKPHEQQSRTMKGCASHMPQKNMREILPTLPLATSATRRCHTKSRKHTQTGGKHQEGRERGGDGSRHNMCYSSVRGSFLGTIHNTIKNREHTNRTERTQKGTGESQESKGEGRDRR